MPRFSEFIATCDFEGGECAIWNSALHLFKSGKVEFKNILYHKEQITKFIKEIEYLKDQIKQQEDGQELIQKDKLQNLNKVGYD
jgi:hypothetical protein